MSIFSIVGKHIRLGSQSFQPLGMWPVTSDAGGRGSTGSAQPAVVPTNVQGYYTRRASVTPFTDQIVDVKTTGGKPNAN
jgi:hypothetical protein